MIGSDAGIIEPRDVYRLIEDQWDWALEPELIARIADAPDDHILAARQTWREIQLDIDSRHALATTDNAGLRPIISPDFRADVSKDLDHVSLLALSSSEMILDSNILYPFGFEIEYPNDFIPPNADTVSADERKRLRDSLQMLMEIRPLIEQGAVKFANLRNAGVFTDIAPITNPLTTEWIAALESESDSMVHFDSLTLRGEALEAEMAVLGALKLAREGQGTPTSFSRLERLFWSAMQHERPIDGGLSRLETLTALQLPTLRTSLTEISKIRRSDEHFDKWRRALNAALNEISALPADATPNEINKASNTFAREVRSELKSLNLSITNSKALTKLRWGGKDMLLSAVSGAGGFATSMPLPVIASVVLGTGLASLGFDYVNSLQKRNADRALWDVAISLVDNTKG